MAGGKQGRGGKRPGAGRKRVPREELQRNRFLVSLTDREHEALLRAAGDEPVAAFVRRVLVRALARRRREER